jgi:hypothetical protein
MSDTLLTIPMETFRALSRYFMAGRLVPSALEMADPRRSGAQAVLATV